MRRLIPEGRPVLVLAPMQDVTDLPFMRVMQEYGGPDYYVTEYFRVHQDSRPEKNILRSITENATGRPIYAQLIGMDVAAMARTVRTLQEYPIAGIDLNMGCPAPVVCNKRAGGGLLRELELIEEILTAMREVVEGDLTVKTRVGYGSHEEFEQMLEVFGRHAIDGFAIHGRTVLERYQTPVHTDCVARAVEVLECPVIANGNVVNVATGRAYHEQTGAAGLMVGRGAIRNPWLFEQLKASYAGEPVPVVRRRDVLGYVELLYAELARETKEFEERRHVNRMKRYMNYIVQGLDEDFEYRVRRAKSEEEFFGLCRAYLEDDAVMPDLPPERSKLFCGFSELLG